MSDRLQVKRKVKGIIRLLEKELGTPVRKHGHNLPDPLDMLVATLLSQNTTDANSYRAWKKLRNKFPDYNSIYRARISSIEAAIKTGGMAKQKAGRIKALLKAIKLKYGRFSLDELHEKSDDAILEELTELKGIGVKTASCVLLFSLGRDSFPVDTHVHRILNRIGIVKTASPEKTFYAMQKLIPPQKMYSFHTNLIRFGRSTCTALRPGCNRCVLLKKCFFGKQFVLGSATIKSVTYDNKKRDFMLLDNIQ
jgi:endonuclease III